jgi:hypothetical protein
MVDDLLFKNTQCFPFLCGIFAEIFETSTGMP